MTEELQYSNRNRDVDGIYVVSAVGRSLLLLVNSETGCMLATCRHAFLLKGLALKRGSEYVAVDMMCMYTVNYMEFRLAKGQGLDRKSVV